MTTLTAYQIRVLVELADLGDSASARALARACLPEGLATPGTVVDYHAALVDLLSRYLIRPEFSDAAWWGWTLTEAGRRAAVLAQSDEIIR